MIAKQLILLVGAACTAAAFAVEKRAQDPALAPLANVPPPCTSTCAILQQYNNINPNDLGTLSAVCTASAEQEFIQCIQCFEQNSPQTFTPELLSALQNSADQLGTGCLLLGSPISSVSFAAPTATGNGTGSSASSPPSASSSTTTSHSNASSRKESRATLATLAVLTSLGATLFL